MKRKLLALQISDLNFNKQSKPIPISPTKHTTIEKTANCLPFESPKVDVNHSVSFDSSNRASSNQQISVEEGKVRNKAVTIDVLQQSASSLQIAYDGESIDSETIENQERNTSLPWPRTLSYYKTLSRDSLSNYSFQPSVRRPNSEKVMKTEEGRSMSPILANQDVTFSYTINDKSQFSPPLSPVLHSSGHVDERFKSVVVETDYERMFSY